MRLAVPVLRRGLTRMEPPEARAQRLRVELLGEIGVLDLHLVRGTPEGVPRTQNAVRQLTDRRPHLTKAADPLLDRRMRREERGEAPAAEWLDDVERLLGLVDLHRDRLRARLEAQQRRGEGLGVAGD